MVQGAENVFLEPKLTNVANAAYCARRNLDMLETALSGPSTGPQRTAGLSPHRTCEILAALARSENAAATA